VRPVYQTLVGAWPIGLERLGPYLQRSLREAKRNTSWTDPNEEWEADVARFASELCINDVFLAEFEPFAADVAAAGSRAALAQLVLGFTSPGIPDLYGGDELPLFALVDPDNRRRVNLERRRNCLSTSVQRLRTPRPSCGRSVSSSTSVHANRTPSPEPTNPYRQAPKPARSRGAATCSSPSRSAAARQSSHHPRTDGATSSARSKTRPPRCSKSGDKPRQAG
jgi:hypothetical protein